MIKTTPNWVSAWLRACAVSCSAISLISSLYVVLVLTIVYKLLLKSNKRNVCKLATEMMAIIANFNVTSRLQYTSYTKIPPPSLPNQSSVKRRPGNSEDPLFIVVFVILTKRERMSVGEIIWKAP